MAQTRKQKILGDVKKARRRRALISTLIVAIIAIGIVAGVILLTPASTVDTALIDKPISPTLYNYLTSVSNTTLSTVGPGQGANKLSKVSGSLLTDSSGKPEVLYMGGDFCPYCAAERWSIIVALSRFGTWQQSSLVYMLSSSTDTPSNVPTFSFSNAVYSSPYISFVAVEVYNRDGGSFQTATPQENALNSQYDQGGGIPFVDVGNQYAVNTGSQYQPSVLLSTGNWTQIGSLLNTPSSAVAKAVDGAANYLITAICKMDGGNPNSICSQSFAGQTEAPIGTTNAPPADSFNMMISFAARPGDFRWTSFPRRIW